MRLLWQSSWHNEYLNYGNNSMNKKGIIIRHEGDKNNHTCSLIRKRENTRKDVKKNLQFFSLNREWYQSPKERKWENGHLKGKIMS